MPVAASALAVLMVASLARAEQSHRTIEVINDSALKVTSYKTERNDAWSDNLLGQPVEAHAHRQVDFAVESGDCRAWTRIDFSDGTYVDADMDYCTTSQITVTFRGISWK